jgi:hypothetical protein
VGDHVASPDQQFFTGAMGDPRGSISTRCRSKGVVRSVEGTSTVAETSAFSSPVAEERVPLSKTSTAASKSYECTDVGIAGSQEGGNESIESTQNCCMVLVMIGLIATLALQSLAL